MTKSVIRIFVPIGIILGWPAFVMLFTPESPRLRAAITISLLLCLIVAHFSRRRKTWKQLAIFIAVATWLVLVAYAVPTNLRNRLIAKEMTRHQATVKTLDERGVLAMFTRSEWSALCNEHSFTDESLATCVPAFCELGLAWLDISGTSITVEGLTPLTNVSSLRVLYLDKNLVRKIAAVREEGRPLLPGVSIRCLGPADIDNLTEREQNTAQ